MILCRAEAEMPSGVIESYNEEPFCVISIWTPGHYPAKIPANPLCREVLHQGFFDLEDPVESAYFPWQPGELYGPEHAQQVIDLVKRHPDVNRFIIHCDAGACRSPATGAALSKYFNGDDQDFFDHYTPNMRVFKTLLKALMEQSV